MLQSILQQKQFHNLKKIMRINKNLFLWILLLLLLVVVVVVVVVVNGIFILFHGQEHNTVLFVL